MKDRTNNERDCVKVESPSKSNKHRYFRPQNTKQRQVSDCCRILSKYRAKQHVPVNPVNCQSSKDDFKTDKAQTNYVQYFVYSQSTNNRIRKKFISRQTLSKTFSSVTV